MPTKHRRIPVTNDPELSDALERVRSRFPGTSTAKVVHDLAVKGAEAIEREQRADAEAIERLAEVSIGRRDLIDWRVLEAIDERAWDE